MLGIKEHAQGVPFNQSRGHFSGFLLKDYMKSIRKVDSILDWPLVEGQKKLSSTGDWVHYEPRATQEFGIPKTNRKASQI